MKLAAYLKLHGITHGEFAMRIGVTQVAVTRYVAGSRTPRPKVISLIARMTDGAVTPNDFMDLRPLPATSEAAE